MPSTEWKKQSTGEKWYPGETISVAIGQGQNSVTPMGLAVMMSTLANGGTRVIPQLVKAVDDGDGWQPVPPPDNPFKPLLFKPEHDLGDSRRPVAGGERRRHGGPRAH